MARLLMALHFWDPVDLTKYHDMLPFGQEVVFPHPEEGEVSPSPGGEYPKCCIKNKVVTKQVYRELLISKLLPAIIEKWPKTDRLSRKIYIQQDGANSHIGEDDKEFKEALEGQDINAKLYTQAANSPDVNLLDLGFF